MKDLLSLTFNELEGELTALGFEKFRTKQVFQWLHQKMVTSFDEMTNLSAKQREILKENYYISSLEIAKKLLSKDGTIKYLFRLPDGHLIETVLMTHNYGVSVCVSTQVGCKMGCEFCASTKSGFVRNLVSGEILSQVYSAQKDSGKTITSIVMMGIGEPLDNYDNSIKFIRIVTDERGKNLSTRSISLSTCGLVDKIYMLAKENLPLTLSVSLHATTDETRSKIMPINKKYNIEKLLTSCYDYIDTTKRRISVEYAIISGINDGKEDALKLAKLLKGGLFHVNLINVNPVKERAFKKAEKTRIEEFIKILESHKISATLRRRLGDDIEAACGQLRIDNM